MGEETFGYEVVCLEDAIDVRAVDTDSDPHDHVLGPFSNTTVDPEKVRSFEGFKAEAGKSIVSRRQ